MIGIDDGPAATAPLLEVTYTVPGVPGSTTVHIFSDLDSDGDIAFDPILNSFTVTTPPPSTSPVVLFGVDSLNANLPEFRAFLTFPLDGATGQPVVPGTAVIVSASLEVFVDRVSFASIIPTFLDLVQYTFRGLAAADYSTVPLAFRTLDFFSTDQGNFVLIDVTPLMEEAQRPPALVDFQVRFSLESTTPSPLSSRALPTEAVRTVHPPPRALDSMLPGRGLSSTKALTPKDQASRHR
jgi:hypothetical protein